MSVINHMSFLAGYAPYTPPGGGTATIVHVDNTFDPTNGLSSYTFTGRSIGTAASDRIVVLGVGGAVAAANRTVTATIGGVSATEISGGAIRSGNAVVSLFALPISSGTTADVAITWSATMTDCHIGLWSIYGATSATPVQVNSSVTNGGATGVNVTAGGVIVGYSFFYKGGSGADPTAVWTGLNENFDEPQVGNDITHSGASFEASSAETPRAISVTISPSVVGMVTMAASFA